MSLFEKIIKSESRKYPCEDCKHFIEPKKDLLFCKIKDKIILQNYPPTKCNQQEVQYV